MRKIRDRKSEKRPGRMLSLSQMKERKIPVRVRERKTLMRERMKIRTRMQIFHRTLGQMTKQKAPMRARVKVRTRI